MRCSEIAMVESVYARIPLNILGGLRGCPHKSPCLSNKGETSVKFQLDIIVVYTTKEMPGSSIDAEYWWGGLDQSL